MSLIVSGLQRSSSKEFSNLFVACYGDGIFASIASDHYINRPTIKQPFAAHRASDDRRDFVAFTAHVIKTTTVGFANDWPFSVLANTCR